MTDPNVSEDWDSLMEEAAANPDVMPADLPEGSNDAEELSSGEESDPSEEGQDTEGDDGLTEVDSSDVRSDDSDEVTEEAQEEPVAEEDPLDDGEELSPREQKKVERAKESWAKADAKVKEAEARLEQVNAQLEQLAQREQELTAKERKLADPLPGHSAESLANAIKNWAENGDYEDVQKGVDVLVNKLNHELSEHSVQQDTNFQSQWEANKQAVVKAHPELKQDDSPLTKAAMGLFASPFGDALKAHPQGITMAVEAAKLQLAADRTSELEAEVETLKSENSKLSKKLAVDGSTASVPASTNTKPIGDFKMGDQKGARSAWEVLAAEAKGKSTQDLI